MSLSHIRSGRRNGSYCEAEWRVGLLLAADLHSSNEKSHIDTSDLVMKRVELTLVSLTLLFVGLTAALQREFEPHDFVAFKGTVKSFRGRIRAKRFDLQTCPETRQVDKATGVAGLRGYLPGRPTRDQVLSALAPPDDLAAWARRAAQERLPPTPELLGIEDLEIVFPDQINQRIVTRFQATVPAGRCNAAISDGKVSWPEIRRNPFSASSNAYESHRLAWSVSVRKRVTRPSLRRVFKNVFSIALVLSSER